MWTYVGPRSLVSVMRFPACLPRAANCYVVRARFRLSDQPSRRQKERGRFRRTEYPATDMPGSHAGVLQP